MAANNIYLQVNFNSAQAQQNVNALNNAIQQTGPTAQKSAQQATQAYQGVNVAIKQTASAFGELTSAIAGLGIARWASQMIEASADLGRAKQMMIAFTGSAEEGLKVFEQIRAIAASSPFRFKDLEESGRTMLAFGMDAKLVPPALKAIVDQVTAMGGSIEQVNALVKIFGRAMDKDFIGAMDVMRLLPALGVKVTEALRKALSLDTEGVKKQIKEGALDPMQFMLVVLNQMQTQTGGTAGKIHDAAEAFKNLGDRILEAADAVFGPNGFGPALETLARQIQELFKPANALMKWFQQLPDWVKSLTVDIAALALAVGALGLAFKAFGSVLGPLFTLLGGVGTLIKGLFTGEVVAGLTAALTAAAPVLAIIAAAVATIALGLEAWSLISPDTFKRFVDKAKEIWEGFKNWITGKSGEIKKAAADGLGDLPKPDLSKLTIEVNFDKAQQEVEKWATEASKTILQAFSSPAEAAVIKYAELHQKLDQMIIEQHITADHAAELHAQFEEAQEMAVQAAVFEQYKKTVAEKAKIDEERVKASYDANIAYIEAMDAQDLRGKVVAIDQITKLREDSAEHVANVQKDALEKTLAAELEQIDKLRAAWEKLGLDPQQIDKMTERLKGDTAEKIKGITQKAEDEAQKYRLEAWKKTNDLIIEDQKRVFEGFKSIFDEMFDAFTDRTKSLSQALGDMFKKLALGEVREMFSSRLAAAATEATGYGRPTEQIARGGGFLYSLFQRGMPPRAPLPPPPGVYTPERTQETIKFDAIAAPITDAVKPMETSSQVFSTASDQMQIAVVDFANAVQEFKGAAVQQSGSADRITGAAVSLADSGDVFSQASAATGVSPTLLRSVAQAESAMRPGAVSSKGAMGLMQLMPGTARMLGVTHPFDAGENVMGGAKYLQQMLTRYGGDTSKALAAYNMGPAAVDRYIASGRPLPLAVQNYVTKVQSLMTGSSPAVVAQTQAQRLFELPEGFSRGPGGEVQYTPQTAAMQPMELPTPPDLFGAYGVTQGTSVAEAAQAKQAGILSQLGGLAPGALGGGAPGGGTGLMGALGRFGNLKGLGQLFGIGATAAGGTSIGSILTSEGVGNLALMGGLSLMSAGIQHRSTGLQVAGGALTGVKLGSMLGMGWLQGPLMGAGIGLFSAGVQKGGMAGLGMDIGGGALAGGMIGLRFGGPIGGLIGAGVGAAVGAITGAIRLVVKTESERIRQQIKQVYGIDISNLQIIAQIKQIVDQKYGGSVSVGIRSQEVQELVRLYALSTGQSTLNMPRPMYGATVAESQKGLQLQKVYQGGVEVQNPYTGPTTYQYQTAVTAAQGLMAGTSLGVPGASGIINNQWTQLTVQTIQGNPGAIAMASAAASRAGDSRLTPTAAMQEPLTALG